jgi:DNA-binding transcriptional LysR family regulator
MDWDKLKIFHIVAKAGSFTNAAKDLNTSQSALSRQIKSLEDSLKISLFTRHARGLVLTLEGEQLYKTADEMATKLKATRLALVEGTNKPVGRLRLTTTITFGSLWLVPRLKEFNELYPDIELQLTLIDEDVDLAMGEADVAIRFRAPKQADLIHRFLMNVNHHIYSSPKYLKEKGTPKNLSDLKKHNIILYGPKRPKSLENINWILKTAKIDPPFHGVLEVNTLFGVLEALKAGMGIATIPDYLAASAPDLVRLLDNATGPAFRAYLIYPSELKRSKRVRAFNDFIISQLN